MSSFSGRYGSDRGAATATLPGALSAPRQPVSDDHERLTADRMDEATACWMIAYGVSSRAFLAFPLFDGAAPVGHRDAAAFVQMLLETEKRVFGVVRSTKLAEPGR
jgi:hypothetical protein